MPFCVVCNHFNYLSCDHVPILVRKQPEIVKPLKIWICPRCHSEFVNYENFSYHQRRCLRGR